MQSSVFLLKIFCNKHIYNIKEVVKTWQRVERKIRCLGKTDITRLFAKPLQNGQADLCGGCFFSRYLQVWLVAFAKTFPFTWLAILSVR